MSTRYKMRWVVCINAWMDYLHISKHFLHKYLPIKCVDCYVVIHGIQREIYHFRSFAPVILLKLISTLYYKNIVMISSQISVFILTVFANQKRYTTNFSTFNENKTIFHLKHVYQVRTEGESFVIN